MNILNQLKFKLVFSLVFILSLSTRNFAQEFILSNANSDLKIFGTSSLHDWHEDVEEQKGFINIDKASALDIKTLKIEIVSESLKSGKRGMDKNTYKALKTDQYKTILFQLTEVKKITQLEGQHYNVQAYGNLTVSGVTKKIQLDFTLALEGNEIKLSGEKTFKMTSFNIDPPKALLGTITTGDEVTIKFNTVFAN